MISVRAEELNAARIFFDKVSVGATMNGMLSAVVAKGQDGAGKLRKGTP